MLILKAGLVAGLIWCLYMLIRSKLTYNYSIYWVWQIYEYKIHCLNSRKLQHVNYVNYDDIVDYNDYLWKLFTFSKDKMIKDEETLHILKNYKQNK